MPKRLTGPGAIPRAPGGWPLLGHVVPLLTTPLAFVTSLPSSGDLVQIRLGPMKAVVVCDPELTRRVLGERFALTEAVLTLAAIAARWHLHPVPGNRVRVPGIVTMRPSGLRMRVRPRTASAGTAS